MPEAVSFLESGLGEQACFVEVQEGDRPQLESSLRPAPLLRAFLMRSDK